MQRLKSKFINPDNIYDDGKDLKDVDERSNYIVPNVIAYHKPNPNVSIEYWRQNLPIFQRRTEFLYSLEKSRVVVVVGETGSGKSTQLPQYIFEAGWLDGNKGMLVTQPRRIAAITLAKKVAEEKNCMIGDVVGYSVRFEDCRKRDETKITFMTEGLLIRELLRDPLLRDYRVIMLDEVHERTVSTDLLLGLMKLVLRKRRNDLRLVISSATVDIDKLVKFYSTMKLKEMDCNESVPLAPKQDCVQLIVEGRQHPVEIYYTLDPLSNYIDGCYEAVVNIHKTLPPGDILVFMCGQDDVLELTDRLRQYTMTNQQRNKIGIEIFPLFANMPYKDQMRVFNYTERSITIGYNREPRRVIVSTNIAETSVTIPGISYVVDCGFTRTVNINKCLSVPTLITVPISKASAEQRAGRAGRIKPGKVFRLYTEESYLKLTDFAPPEMVRSELSRTILEMKALGIDKVVRFPFLSPPPVQHLRRALETLYALGCLDRDGSLTERGNLMTDLPLHPCAAAMLVAAATLENCSAEAAVIAALMQVQSIFVSTPNQHRAFEKVQRQFACVEGDHVTQLNALRAFEREVKRTGGDKQMMGSWCGRHFINKAAAYKALAIRDCLKTVMLRHKLPWVSCGLDSRPLVRAIIRGFYTQVATLMSSGVDGGSSLYRVVVPGVSTGSGSRSQLLDVHPNSVVSRLQWEVLSGTGSRASPRPRWVVFGALISLPMVSSSDSLCSTAPRDCMDAVTVIPGSDAESICLLTELAPHYFRLGTTRQLLDSAELS